VSFDEAGRAEFRKQHGLTDKFVVMYSGNHSPVHPLNTVMQAADLLQAKKEIVFCFIGGGSMFGQVKQWAAGSHQILCLPYQPLDKLSASLSAADAHLIVMGNAMLGLVHPCKIYNILAVGAPTVYVGPNPSHITEIFEGLPQYRWVSARHGEAAVLAQQIRDLAAEGNRGHRECEPGTRKEFSRAALAPKMIAAIEADGKCGDRRIEVIHAGDGA
jgi:hypothetical protein